jgi:hypothetical protein
MTEPLPGAPIPASSTEGYTIRIPKLALPIKGNRTYALAAAVGLAALYALAGKLRGVPLDLSFLPQIIDLLLTSEPAALLAPLLGLQIAAHRAGVKDTEKRTAARIDALRSLITAAMVPGGPEAAAIQEKMDRLKALKGQVQALLSTAETETTTTKDTPT